jgi:Dyp-type peroxidase family
MRLVAGIDTPKGNWAALVKIDIVSNERDTAIACLQHLNEVLQEIAIVPTSLELGQSISSFEQRATVLIGFSARFFKGPLTRNRDTHQSASRFGIKKPVPKGLKKMNLVGDGYFREVCTEEQIGNKESDLLVLFESFFKEEYEELLTKINSLTKPLQIKAIHKGFQALDNRDHTGFKDGTSNLQDIKSSQPERYQSYVYVHDGEAGNSIYDGGTYLVFRKYIENLPHWFSNSFRITDKDGKSYYGNVARERAMGRSTREDLVIDRDTGEHLAIQFDSEEGCRAYNESHIRHANPRRYGITQFGDPVVLQDVRILRRGFSFTESGINGTKHGLLFICFQSNIQERGFEFINNQWLMAGGFMGCKDKFLDPASGIVEPIDGCYYYIPTIGEFPGSIFFD